MIKGIVVKLMALDSMPLRRRDFTLDRGGFLLEDHQTLEHFGVEDGDEDYGQDNASGGDVEGDDVDSDSDDGVDEGVVSGA